MRRVIRLALIAATFFMLYAGAQAHALKIDSGDNKTVYISKDGHVIDGIEAYKKAIAGEDVLACNPVEAVGNKRTGKVTLKKKQ